MRLTFSRLARTSTDPARAVAAGFLPIASYCMAHMEVADRPLMWALVAAGLAFSAPTLAEWADVVNRLDGVRLAAADMAGVDQLITERMQSDVPVIPALAEHLIAAGGKRLRPILTVVAAQVAGPAVY